MPVRISAQLLLAAVLAVVLIVAACSEDDPAAPPANPTTGTIIVDVEPDDIVAEWTCTALSKLLATGQGDTVMTDMVPGDYELNWGGCDGCTAPQPDTLTLAAGDTITFAGTYISFPPPPPPFSRWLFAIEGGAPGEVYAAGMGGRLFRFAGSERSALETGTTEPIVDLFREDDGTVWACGHEGLLLHLSGTTVTPHDLGTDADLYTVGRYDGVLHVGGAGGLLMRRDGDSWSTITGEIIMRDFTGTPVDTLSFAQDLAAITTISHHFIGGAYHRPEWNDDPIGIEGTDGMVLTADAEYEWQLQEMHGGQHEDPEWVSCATSDPDVPGNNWVGTSWGWAFQLTDVSGTGLEWEKYPQQLTGEPAEALRDMWMSFDGDLYLVSGLGAIIYLPAGGVAEVLYDSIEPLMGIWGVDSFEMYVVGYLGDTILRCTHDNGGTFNVEEIDISELW